MSDSVQCVRCSRAVSQAQTTFTPSGGYLCQTCTNNVDLAMQVEAARQEGLAKANRSRGGLIGWLFGRWKANKDHEELLAQINQTSTHQPCSGC